MVSRHGKAHRFGMKELHPAKLTLACNKQQQVLERSSPLKDFLRT
jgi:hypothetical protein